jgi:hypothetical protein
MNQYVSSHDPTEVLEVYLTIHSSGCYVSDVQSYDNIRYDGYNSCKDAIEMIYLIQSVGVEFVILWNAIMLQKRFMVQTDNISKMLSVVSANYRFMLIKWLS